jgi:hypothetical protein
MRKWFDDLLWRLLNDVPGWVIWVIILASFLLQMYLGYIWRPRC